MRTRILLGVAAMTSIATLSCTNERVAAPLLTAASSQRIANTGDGGGPCIATGTECPPPKPGRMTGGGKQITVGGVSVTRGFTIHCDITLSNNIEINWPDNKWHLDKPIDTALCIDNPDILPEPPAAPFDTFIGTATGKLNGVDGAVLEFTFIDAGEPGTFDQAAIRITDVNGNVVLSVPLLELAGGNIQAHFDQPHK